MGSLLSTGTSPPESTLKYSSLNIAVMVEDDPADTSVKVASGIPEIP